MISPPTQKLPAGLPIFTFSSAPPLSPPRSKYVNSTPSPTAQLRRPNQQTPWHVPIFTYSFTPPSATLFTPAQGGIASQILLAATNYAYPSPPSSPELPAAGSPSTDAHRTIDLDFDLDLDLFPRLAHEYLPHDSRSSYQPTLEGHTKYDLSAQDWLAHRRRDLQDSHPDQDIPAPGAPLPPPLPSSKYVVPAPEFVLASHRADCRDKLRRTRSKKHPKLIRRIGEKWQANAIRKCLALKMSNREFAIATDWSYFIWLGACDVIRAFASEYASHCRMSHAAYSRNWVRASLAKAIHMAKGDGLEESMAGSSVPTIAPMAVDASQDGTMGITLRSRWHRTQGSDDSWLYRPARHVIGTVKVNARKRKWDEYLEDAAEEKAADNDEDLVVVSLPEMGPRRKKQIHYVLSGSMIDCARKTRVTRTSRGHRKTRMKSSFFFAADGARRGFAHMVESVSCPPRCPYPIIHKPSPLHELWSADDV